MSIVPFAGHRPSPTHPDAFRTAQALGRIARQVYDHYSKSGESTASLMAPRRSSGRRVKGGSATSMSPTNQADLRVRPPSRTPPRSVPRNISMRIAWDVVKIVSTISVSTSTTVETNFVFQLAQNPQASSWASLFDQYAIPQASVSFQSLLPPGSVTNGAEMVTALDFDSNANLGSLNAVGDYSTAEACYMGQGATVLRSVQPCLKVATSTSGSLAPTLTSYQWVDSAFFNSGTGANAAPLFYGVRSILALAPVAYQIVVVQTIWFCFRNQI